MVNSMVFGFWELNLSSLTATQLYRIELYTITRTAQVDYHGGCGFQGYDHLGIKIMEQPKWAADQSILTLPAMAPRCMTWKSLRNHRKPPMGPKYPNTGYLWVLSQESQLWFSADTLYLGTWTLRDHGNSVPLRMLHETTSCVVAYSYKQPHSRLASKTVTIGTVTRHASNSTSLQYPPRTFPLDLQRCVG